MDINQIMATIPHRYPFLLIDKVTELIPGEKITAVKNVTANENFFTGHFPREPVMPGVLMIEAMAQAGACAVLTLEEYKGKIAFLGAVNNAKFRAKVKPGDTLVIEVSILKLKTSAGIGKGIIYAENKKVAEAEITFMIG